MIDSYGHLWEEIMSVMVVLHLWPTIPIVLGAVFLFGLVIWFVERLFGLGGNGE